jgi:2',3'-cyclic-nucleotide 2'-phosphodiesterase (5'-nucleotidase family)
VRRLRFAIVALLLSGSCSKHAPPPSKSSEAPIRVVILHTADLHGRVDRLSSIASFIAAESARGRVVVVDAGDFFQGTPEGDLTRGRAVLDAFNEMRVDALVPGNHDFDLGPAVAADLARAARFPFLAANLRGAAWVRPSVAFPELRIEILGLAPDAMDRLSTRRAREGLAFTSAESAITAHAWNPGVARILVTHLGIERDRALPLNGIAAVLGGHTHVAAIETLPNGTILMHPGALGTSIGRLELDPATGAVRSARAEVVDVPEVHDARIEAIVEARAGEIRRMMDERIGRLEADLPRGGPEYDGISSPLGNHVAELVMHEGGAEAAVILRSSIRASLFAGPVRRRDLYEATPFPDAIVAVTVTGAKLRGALERAVAGDERILVEVAGIELAYDRSAPRYRRIRRLEVAGVPLDPRRRYRVATLSFMLEPGGLLAGGSDVRDTSRSVLDAQVDFLRAHSPFQAPAFRPRIGRTP